MDHGAMPLLHLLKQTQHLAKTLNRARQRLSRGDYWAELPVDYKDTQSGAPKRQQSIAKLVYNSNKYVLRYLYVTIDNIYLTGLINQQ